MACGLLGPSNLLMVKGNGILGGRRSPFYTGHLSPVNDLIKGMIHEK